MERLDTEPSDTTVTALSGGESSEDLFETLDKSAPANQDSPAYSSDIFEDTFSSSTPAAGQCLTTKHQNDIFFSLEDATDESPVSVFDQQGSLTPAKEKAARVEEVSAGSSLFDDLSDFSSPLTSETDHIVVDNTADGKPVPKVDLLFDVDDDLVSPTGSQPEVKAKAPDILDFVDVSCDLPEITSMDATDGSVYESLTDGWDLLTDVTSSKTGLDQSPDLVATFSGRDAVLDSTDDEDEVTLAELKEDESDGAAGDKQSNNDKHTENADDAEQITDGDVKEKTADIHFTISESDKMKDSFQDIDFSVLELPGASNFNFDHFKHKRNISQKGSIANRKKPKRATIQPVGEDSIFLDSTEPKSQKPPNEDVPDSGLSLDHSKGDKAPETSGELSEETSPTRKLAGGIKIPGLLEGLSKSKAFARAEKTSPVAEPESKPEVVNPPPALDTETPPTALSSVTSPPMTTSSPLIRPKPVVLPRVLPKPATKTLQSQNQVTASSIVTRASSFRNATSTFGSVDKPSLLASPVALSRSASVKVTPVSASKDVELSLVKEEKSPAVPVSKLIPPKPELKKPLSPAAVRSVNKTPPPVPVKPSVAAKPGRASLGWSASFSGGKSPLLPVPKSETQTEVAVNKEQKSDSDVIVNAENKVDYINTASKEKNYVSDNKPLSSGSSSEGKPLSFVQKKTEIPNAVTSSEKTDATEKIIDSTNITRTEKKYILDKKPLSPGSISEGKPLSFVQKKTEIPDAVTSSEKTDATEKIIDSTNITMTEKKYILDKKPLLSGFSSERKTPPFFQKKTEVLQTMTASEKTDATEKKFDSTNTGSTEKKYVSDKTPLSSTFNSERKPPSFVQKKMEVPHAVTSLEKPEATVENVKSALGGAETSKNTSVNRISSVRASLPSGFVPRPGFRAGENYANVEAKKADTVDADDVFDTAADKTVSSVNTESSNSADKYDSANNVDDILQRRKSSISGVTPVKSPLTGEKFPSGVMPRKGSITGSAYNPIGFRSTLGSSDSDQRSRTSSVSSSAEGAILAPESANLLSSVASPSPKPRAGSDASSEDQMSRNGSLITAAVEKVRSSPDTFSEGGSEKTTKSDTKPDTKLISSLLPNKGDQKKTEFSETKRENQKPPKPLRDSTSPAQLNGGPASGKGGQASDKTTSPWNVQLKKVDKKEPPKPEPAVKTNDSQPANWRQQLSVRQKSSVPPKNTEKPKQDSTPEWAKASIKRRQRLIESGVIRGDS